MNLTGLKDRLVEWLKGGPEGDVVVSSRVRLARNIDGYPFVSRCTRQQKARIEELVRNVLLSLEVDPPLHYVRLHELRQLDRELLMERHLISRKLAEADWVCAVSFDDAEQTSIMVNEQDHVRIQCIRGGLRLDEVYERADQLDDLIATRIPFAYSRRYGYLTASPLNVGTGVRATATLHLPGIVMAHDMDQVIKVAQEQNLALRGVFGEGTHGAGDFYQLYNQVTLGLAEEAIVSKVSQAALKLAEMERSCRASLYRDHPEEFSNRISRAFSMLSSAAAISSQEALSFLSQVRLGVEMNLLSSIRMRTINDLFLLTLPAHLQTMEGRELDSSVRNKLRATYVKTRLTTG